MSRSWVVAASFVITSLIILLTGGVVVFPAGSVEPLRQHVGYEATPLVPVPNAPVRILHVSSILTEVLVATGDISMEKDEGGLFIQQGLWWHNASGRVAMPGKRARVFRPRFINNSTVMALGCMAGTKHLCDTTKDGISRRTALVWKWREPEVPVVQITLPKGCSHDLAWESRRALIVCATQEGRLYALDFYSRKLYSNASYYQLIWSMCVRRSPAHPPTHFLAVPVPRSTISTPLRLPVHYPKPLQRQETAALQHDLPLQHDKFHPNSLDIALHGAASAHVYVSMPWLIRGLCRFTLSGNFSLDWCVGHGLHGEVVKGQDRLGQGGVAPYWAHGLRCYSDGLVSVYHNSRPAHVHLMQPGGGATLHHLESVRLGPARPGIARRPAMSTVRYSSAAQHQGCCGGDVVFLTPDLHLETANRRLTMVFQDSGRPILNASSVAAYAPNCPVQPFGADVMFVRPVVLTEEWAADGSVTLTVIDCLISPEPSTAQLDMHGMITSFAILSSWGK
eukprot:gene3119-3657_t